MEQSAKTAFLAASELDSSRQNSGYLPSSSALTEFPSHTFEFHSCTYRYVATRRDSETAVLFIHGVGTGYDIWWKQIAFFESRFRVVAVDVPAEADPAAIVQAIDKILIRERIQLVHIVANSFGGCIAQWFANQYPERVSSIALINSFFPRRFDFKATLLCPIDWICMAGNHAMQWLQRMNGPAIVVQANADSVVERIMRSLKRTREYKAALMALTNSPDLKWKTLTGVNLLAVYSSDYLKFGYEPLRSLKAYYQRFSVQVLDEPGYFPFLTAGDNINLILAKWMVTAAPELPTVQLV